MKYVFLTGGVVSSLGKGITAASLGKLLKARGYHVSLQKLDLYYNVEPGFLSPLEHGEAFITDDGVASDLDLGHFERFVDTTLPGDASSTTGKIHRRLIERELRGEYRGSTIQAIPHVANEIKRCIREAAENAGSEIQLVEIGGTVGDMEASVYLEAIRQMRWECPNPNDCCYIHVTLMPYIVTAGELKTKPTQNSVKVLRSTGIQPDVIVCRTEVPMTTESKDKIALFCNVKASNVIQNLDVECLYEVPLMLEKEGLARAVLAELGLENRPAELEDWKELCKHSRELDRTVRVALVGKYTTVPDAYLSVAEALRHAGLAENTRIALTPINSEDIVPETADTLLAPYQAIVVPGGYGDRGTDGMVVAARYAREHRVPFLAIGFGMQLAVVEAVRDLLGITDANTTEVDPQTTHPVAHIPEDRICQNDSRGATRMGGSDVLLQPGLLRSLYGADAVRERHSNRYEIDPQYIEPLAEKGFKLVGSSAETGYPEAFELEGHPFFVAVVYHPEYQSRPNRPHPIYRAFVRAALAGNEA
ncbi:MAG: CTP synthase [Candidatus Limiplasma sp.]|nr:CTP synthase [Candidatus Limiplasma sp.]